MRRKKEKGFKRIKIVDSYTDAYYNSFFNIFNVKYALIFLIIILFAFILYEIFSIIHQFRKATFDYSYEFLDDNENNNEENNKTNLVKPKKNFTNLVKFEKKTNLKENNSEKEKEITITIIILVGNEDNEFIEKMINNINSQTLSGIEIIIIEEFLNDKRNSFYDKITKENKAIKIFNCKNKTGNFVKKISGVEKSNGKYITFLEINDYFSSETFLESIYNISMKNGVDIIEYITNIRLGFERNTVIYQPQLYFDNYFQTDNFRDIKQFHIKGKIIRKELFMRVVSYIDDYYFQQNINYFDDNMLLLILFRHAESYELLDLHVNQLINLDNNKNLDPSTDQQKLEFLIYLKFIFEYGDDTVPDKRQAAHIFINSYRTSRNFDNHSLFRQLLRETVDLYVNCEKISDEDKNKIKGFEGN